MTGTITLTNLKISPALSHETLAFTATLCLAGTPIGSVENDGQGGSNLYRFPDREDRARFEQQVATFAQEQHVSFEPADLIVAILIEQQVGVAA